MIIISFHLHGIHLPSVGLPTAVHLAEPSPTNDSGIKICSLVTEMTKIRLVKIMMIVKTTAEPSSTNDSVTKNMSDVLWVIDDKDRLVKK